MEQVLIKSNVNKWLLIVFKFFLDFSIFFLLNASMLNGKFAPFTFGLYLALCLITKKYFWLSLTFLLASLLASVIFFKLTLATLICAFSIVAMTGLCLLIKKRLAKKLNIFYVAIFSIFINIPSIILNYSNFQAFLPQLLNLFLGVLFTIACYIFCLAVIKRRVNLKFNIDELICGALLVVALFSGLFGVKLGQFSLVRLVAVFFVLAVAYNYNYQSSTMIGLTMGLGVALASADIEYIALFALMGLVGGIFKTENKIFSCISVILVDLLMGLYFVAFENYSLYALLGTIISAFIFFILPNKIIKKLSFVKNDISQDVAIKSLLNQNKAICSKKLNQTSQVFYEMDKLFRNSIRGNLPVADAKKMLVVEVIQNVCEKCENKNKCFRGENARQIFEDLVSVGFEKGKISLVDLPQYITSRCNKVGQLVNTENALLRQYCQYANMINNLDASKILIAEQLRGVSKILNNLGCELNSNVVFDSDKENKINQKLVYNNIIAQEVVVFNTNSNLSGVSVLLKTDPMSTDKVFEVVNGVCKAPMVLQEVLPSNISGYSLLNFRVAPKFDVAFGLAQTAKENNTVSGDTHSLLRLGGDKFLLALCDGMGNGEDANKNSTIAISLVENFYKAGFDSETILNSVNKFLNLGGRDNFSAIDICVLDLQNSFADFIKLGAVKGYIKHATTTTIIESGALPLGILDEVNPKITKTVLEPSDAIILLSDGISDVMSEDELLNFINNIKSVNPQEIADKILARAIALSKNLPQDDMTVLTARIFLI